MKKQTGFTLSELMVAVAVVGILTAIALPSYSAYVFRSRIPAGLDALAAYQTRMEQGYQDTGIYGTTACTAALPVVPNFALSCTLSNAGQGFTATVTGAAPVAGVSYSVDHNGTRLTLTHPKGAPAQPCWSIRGAVCDS
jgi:type IV pilus assembly protein PilE